MATRFQEFMSIKKLSKRVTALSCLYVKIQFFMFLQDISNISVDGNLYSGMTRPF